MLTKQNGPVASRPAAHHYLIPSVHRSAADHAGATPSANGLALTLAARS